MTVTRRYIESSSFKMAFLFTVLLAVSATILGYFLIDFGKRDFLRETEAAIDIEINMISSLEQSKNNSLLPYIKQRANDDEIVRFRYEDENSDFIGGSIDPMPGHIEKFAEGVLRFDLDTPSGKKVFASKIHTFQDGSRLIIARNVNELIASYERLKHLSWLVMGLMLCVVLVSFGISYFVVSRINRISNIAQTIAETGDLSQRITIDSAWDDLSSLSKVLNGFLDQIQELMHGIREVSNNIAHDLRTPLSGLRSDIEALKNQRVTDKHIDALLSEADHILSIFQALLRITNIEKGKRSHAIREVNVGNILRDVIDLYEPVAEEKNIAFLVSIPDSAFINGDSDLLFQLFANVTDNAIKFSPKNSVIKVAVTDDNGQTATIIEDQGSGIPDQEKERVFKHFYRCDTSRSTPGNGLGLSLVKAVVEYHQAQIALEDVAPGLRVKITFQPYK